MSMDHLNQTIYAGGAPVHPQQSAMVKPRARVTTTLWEDENTLCFQVEARGISVARREDNDMINGTKLLNVAGMTRGRRDGMLKAEKVRHVVKIGAMHLKGVWIPFERAVSFAQKENIFDLLYPLFIEDIRSYLYRQQNPATNDISLVAGMAGQHGQNGQMQMGQMGQMGHMGQMGQMGHMGHMGGPMDNKLAYGQMGHMPQYAQAPGNQAPPQSGPGGNQAALQRQMVGGPQGQRADQMYPGPPDYGKAAGRGDESSASQGLVGMTYQNNQNAGGSAASSAAKLGGGVSAGGVGGASGSSNGGAGASAGANASGAGGAAAVANGEPGQNGAGGSNQGNGSSVSGANSAAGDQNQYQYGQYYGMPQYNMQNFGYNYGNSYPPSYPMVYAQPDAQQLAQAQQTGAGQGAQGQGGQASGHSQGSGPQPGTPQTDARGHAQAGQPVQQMYYPSYQQQGGYDASQMYQQQQYYANSMKPENKDK